MKKVKIAIGGPSGGGKSTIAEYISKKYKLTHIQSEITRGIDAETARDWEVKYGYKSDGHSNLIAHQASNPNFAIEWQNHVLRSRKSLIERENNFILDRSPLDNIVYSITQMGFNVSDDILQNIITSAQAAQRNLTHFILLRSVNPPEVGIEDNGSRVTSRIWQKSIDAVFVNCFFQYLKDVGVPYLVIDFWNLEDRKIAIDKFLQENP